MTHEACKAYIEALEKYILGLKEELYETSLIAYTHGWRTRRYEEGVRQREQLAKLKEIYEQEQLVKTTTRIES